MFEAAASMSTEQLIDVAYYTRLALQHWYTPDDLRQYPILAGSSSEPSSEDQELACRWLEEIQDHEGRPINQFDGETISRYVGELSDMILNRTESERPPIDPERAERLLEELRRAVPWPPLDLRRAG
ncbi:MAG: hypothetical protein QOF89_44 [Acidobacteriota bacterium]|jgi:hypothetical protein|nr:hypothetical protein [Acidobacteriota bacterium]